MPRCNMEAALRHYVAADLTDWDDQLPWVEFALNSSFHDSIQSTPFALNRICLPRNPFDAVLDSDFLCQTPLSRSMGLSRLSPHVDRSHVQAAENLQWAKLCVQQAKERMKLIHDKRAATPSDPAWDFNVGDRVWFNIKNVRTRHPEHRRKLLPRYWGPFSVIARPSRTTVKLDFPPSLNIWPVVSVTLVKPFKQRANEPPPVQIRGEEHWVVDSIVSHSITKPKKSGPPTVTFCVKWHGAYENSWHEIWDLEGCMESLSDYLLTRLTLAARKKVVRALTPDARALLPEHLKALL